MDLDNEDENIVVEYRCSMCQQIGGDNVLGVYDGCPKNGGKKHDTSGGVVK